MGETEHKVKAEEGESDPEGKEGELEAEAKEAKAKKCKHHEAY